MGPLASSDGSNTRLPSRAVLNHLVPLNQIWLSLRGSTSCSSLKPMKKLLYVSGAVLITSLSCRAGTAEQEKAFTDKYKAAFEAKDTATLESFLYTQGADPVAVEFYKMMQTGEAGGKISKIELVALTPEDAAKAAAPQDAPTGGKVCLPLKPIK